MIFGVHMHQPTDNFDEVIKKAVELCYRPFFEVMEKGEFKFSFHCSGWLFEKIKNEYKDVFNLILALHKKGLIEFFTGGFYEPILVTIPKEDRIYQINKLNDFLFKEFGVKPKGLWLTERVWDYSIFDDLVKCGIEYVVVDDNHFFKASINDINGYYLSENNGNRLFIFPISKSLRYAIPFKDYEDIKILLQNNLLMFDDIEKFGLWPNTYKRVYEEKWLERFIKKFKSIHFKEYINKNSPIDIAYIKDTSYEEMEEWSGGVFRNFFKKYKESNHLHKRMIQLSKEIKNENLYKLQTNDVYWHGVFGGLFLPNLRDNAYRYLIECEKELNKKGIIEEDFNFDGKKEIFCYFDDFIYIFNSYGELIEFDDKNNSFNFLNTLKKYKENVKSKKSDSKIKSIHEIEIKIDDFNEDKYYRYSFVDYFIDDNFDYFKWKNNEFQNKKVEYRFDKSNFLFSNKKITKKYKIDNNKIEFFIDTDLKYAMELNLHFAGDILLDNEIFKEDIFNKGNLTIKDLYTKRTIEIISKAKKIYTLKNETISRNEGGVDKILQNYSFLLVFDKEIKGYLNVRN